MRFLISFSSSGCLRDRAASCEVLGVLSHSLALLVAKSGYQVILGRGPDMPETLWPASGGFLELTNVTTFLLLSRSWVRLMES